MDLNLQTMSITIVLGAYFLLGLTSTFFILFERPLPNLWRSKPSGDQTAGAKLAGPAAVTLVLAVFFMFGMLMEDVSNKFVDVSETFWSRIPGLSSEDDLRVEALFGDDLGNGSGPIGEGWARAGLLRRYGGARGGDVEDAVVGERWCALAAEPDTVRAVAREAYYRSKNTVYRDRSYFEELQEIQRRIDFARSLAILTCMLLVASFLVLAARLASVVLPFGRLQNLWTSMRGAPPATPSPPADEDAGQLQYRAFLRWVGIWAVLMTLFFTAGFAYGREEIEFNRRSFGYFLTMETDGSPSPARGLPADASGLAPLGERTLLVVHDTKTDRPLAPRVGILDFDRVDEERPFTYRSVDVAWKPPHEPSNDLEAACAMPGRPLEFLLAESGPDREGRPGRLFHLEVKEEDGSWRGFVRRTFTLPQTSGGGPLDYIEGLGCIEDGEGRVRVYLCERGSNGRPARLRWTTIPSDPRSDGGRLVLPEEAQLELLPPSEGWHDPSKVRTCSDLYLDPDRRLWISAAEDPDVDGGPFRSVVYEAGLLPADGGTPELAGRREVARLDGLKVEALGPGILSSADLSVATDDEAYGGVWRPVRLDRRDGREDR